MSARDELILETLEAAGVPKEDQFDTLVSVLKLTPHATSGSFVEAVAWSLYKEDYPESVASELAVVGVPIRERYITKAQHAIAALTAAGWMKPRTITTVEELDALADYSAVMLAGRDGLICQKRYGSWALMGFDERVSLPQIAGDLPATVIHEGQA